MKKLELKFNDAYNKVREYRPIIAPNLIFMSQLMDYETKLADITVDSPINTRQLTVISEDSNSSSSSSTTSSNTNSNDSTNSINSNNSFFIFKNSISNDKNNTILVCN